MKDGDYKFQLDVQKQYKDLLNKGNNKKRIRGNLIVEIVPKDRKSSDVYLPKKGDDVQVWGAAKINPKAGTRFIRLGRSLRNKLFEKYNGY